MGKKLIIKGADFSENAVDVEPVLLTRTVTPTFTDGSGILVNTGEVNSVNGANQKYCVVNLQTSDRNVICRATGSADWGIAFFNGTTFISGIGYADFDLHTIEIPQNATMFKYSYLKNSRASELSKPIVSTMDIQYNNN